jgi:putative adenylate-forming enzyme
MNNTVSTSRLILLRHYLGARWRFTRLHGEALLRYQDRLAHTAVREAISKSPYYANRFSGQDFKDWRNLPLTDKQAMMANFTELNTQNVSLDLAMETALRAERDRDFSPLVPNTDLTVGLSSGTSGHRGLFLVGPKERAAWAGNLLARALPGSLLRRGGWRVAFFHRSGSNLYQSLASRALSFRFVDLMTPIAEAVDHLNRFQPHLLVVPPTMLLLLAKEQREGRLRLRPEKVISVAEVLEPQDALLIAESFAQPCVHQIYQCTEGLLAVTCSRGVLHLQEDVVAIQTTPLGEDLPDQERPVTPIVTDLWRRVQPIIRYQLGDVLALAPDNEPLCACGSRFRRVLRVEGRCDDVLQFPCIDNPGEMRPFFPDTLRRTVLLADAGITDYRVVQKAPGCLQIHLALLPGQNVDTIVERVRESVLRTIGSYGCRLEKLSIESGLPEEALGRKRRRVQRIPGTNLPE